MINYYVYSSSFNNNAIYKTGKANRTLFFCSQLGEAGSCTLSLGLGWAS